MQEKSDLFFLNLHEIKVVIISCFQIKIKNATK